MADGPSARERDGVHIEEREGAAKLSEPGGGEEPRIRLLQDRLQIHPYDHGYLQPRRCCLQVPAPLHNRLRDPQERPHHQSQGPAPSKVDIVLFQFGSADFMPVRLGFGTVCFDIPLLIRPLNPQRSPYN